MAAFEQSVSAELKRVFFQESVYQPELYQVALDPQNVRYIYDTVVQKLGRTIGFDDFLSVSTETLGANLRDPFRPDSLVASLSNLNRTWIDLLLKRFASERNGAAAYYQKAVMQNFVQNPAEFQAPIASSIHGHKILIQPIGFGSDYQSGLEESERIRVKYATGSLEKLFG